MAVMRQADAYILCLRDLVIADRAEVGIEDITEKFLQRRLFDKASDNEVATTGYCYKYHRSADCYVDKQIAIDNPTRWDAATFSTSSGRLGREKVRAGPRHHPMIRYGRRRQRNGW